MAGEWKTLGNELVALINLGVYDEPFVTSRIHGDVPRDAKFWDTNKCLVAPVNYARVHDTRADYLLTMRFGIYLGRLIKGGLPAAVLAAEDSLQKTADQITEEMQRHETLLDKYPMNLQEGDGLVVFDEEMYSQGIFITELIVEVHGVRQMAIGPAVRIVTEDQDDITTQDGKAIQKG